MKRILYILLLSCTLGGYSYKAKAIEFGDPGLPPLIWASTKSAQKYFAAQEAAMVAQTGGHIWFKSEMTALNKSLEEFDNYLRSFNHTIAYAAQIYGFYHEVEYLVKNIEYVTKTMVAHPANTFAVALRNDKKNMYLRVGERCLDILDNMRKVIFKKMTEKDRMELAFSIRPKLQALNHDLEILSKMIRYTTMASIWYNIYNNARPRPQTNGEIARRCLETWKLQAIASKEIK